METNKYCGKTCFRILFFFLVAEKVGRDYILRDYILCFCMLEAEYELFIFDFSRWT